MEIVGDFTYTTIFTGCNFKRKMLKQGPIESRKLKFEVFIELENGDVLKLGLMKIKRPLLQNECFEGMTRNWIFLLKT